MKADPLTPLVQGISWSAWVNACNRGSWGASLLCTVRTVCICSSNLCGAKAPACHCKILQYFRMRFASTLVVFQYLMVRRTSAGRQNRNERKQ